MRWWQLKNDEVIEKTASSEKGLTSEAVTSKRKESGPNELEEKKRKPAWKIFLGQFKDFMILVLIAAAIVAGFAGDLTDTIIILVIVVLNAVVGFIQENKAEKAMEALKKISALHAQVMRDGKLISIPAAELVPGDLVKLEAGNVVPADIRLIETHGLRVNESALTGESVPSEKNERPIPDEDLPVGDRLNMTYKSTLVANGRAKGIVVAVGMQTEIGNIAKMLQQKEEATPLQKRMTDFGRKLSFIVIAICVGFFVIGYMAGQEPLNLLLTAISLAVAAIPEALPALITVGLASGAKKLIKKNALIRKLSAVETLGSVTFICSDKTGTLTQNRMKVVEAQEEKTGEEIHSRFNALECGMALNHDVKKGGDGKLHGDPTEIALAEYFVEKHSADDLTTLWKEMKRVKELPFDSDRKCMSTVHRVDGRYTIIAKGAVEALTSALKDGQDTEPIAKRADEWANDGMRVMAYAYRIVKEIPDPFKPETVEKDLTMAGIVGMIDPPREEARLALEECKTAGIKTVMITGDHPATASAIARQLGVLSPDDLVVTGKELQQYSDDEFEEKVERIRVYARVSPEQKLKIVKALQKKDHFVSMTGDGVNDAPSLKASNIGVAMGITGTDVSKEASDMILLDDNFATIVRAVREGRHIYDNIRKFVKYIMTCNGAEILTMVVGPLLGLPIPLLPIHILWINLVTDGLPGLALASERPEEGIMKRPPRKTTESLFAGGIGIHIIWVGVLMATVTLGTQAWAIDHGKPHWQTMVFTVLSFAQLGHVMGIRSENQFLFKLGLFSNLPLLGAVTLTVLLQLAVIYLPFANSIFKTQPLTIGELITCMLLASVVLVGVELEKWIKKVRRVK